MAPVPAILRVHVAIQFSRSLRGIQNHSSRFHSLTALRTYSSGNIRDDDKEESRCPEDELRSKTSFGEKQDAETHHHHAKITHRVTEKLSFAMLERILDGYLGRTARGVGERAAERVGGRIGERVGERAAERVGERIGERAAERIGERAAERIGERAAERIGERAAERIGERAAERIGERTASSLAGRTTEKLVPKAGERLAERLLFRIGRGMAVALPALGSLFVLHLAREDRRRANELSQQGHALASRAFWLAFLGDASDVLAHVVTVTCLLQSHYNAGIHLPHAWLHIAETGGWIVAAISTLAAIVGELLAAKHLGSDE